MPSSTRKKRAHSTSIRRNRERAGRTKRNSSLRRISSKKLGEGAFGLVQRPPAPCKPYEDEEIYSIIHDIKNSNNNIYKRYAHDNDIDKYVRKLEAKYAGKSFEHLKPYLTYLKYFANDSYISKLTEYEKARHEFMVGRYISSIIPNWREYYCLVEYFCKAYKDATNNDPSDSLAIMEYCGTSLEKLISGKSGTDLDKNTWWFILDSLKNTFTGLVLLHREYIYHNDIHAGNVVFNLGTDIRNGSEPYSLYKTLLIDFGQTVVLQGDDERGNDKQVLYNAIDDLHNFIVKVIKPVLAYIVRKNIFDSEADTIKRSDMIHLIKDINKIPEPYKTSSIKQLQYMKDKYYKVFDMYETIIPAYVG